MKIVPVFGAATLCLTIIACGGAKTDTSGPPASASSLPSSSSSSSSSDLTGVRTTGCDGETSGLSASKIHYVSPTGTANGDSFDSAMSFTAAISAVNAGEMILLEPGTYTIPYTQDVKNTIILSKSGVEGSPIYMTAANCGRALFDFSTPPEEFVDAGVGFSLTGNYWYIKNIDVTRAGYHGMYIGSVKSSGTSDNIGQHNTIENCTFFDNRNTGLEINNGAAYNTVINSDSFKNYDVKKSGGMADGFASKQYQGPGNRFYGCRAWNNSDDGFDFFNRSQSDYESKGRQPHSVIVENSWAFNNGIDIWDKGYAGNGSGFKLGGNPVAANNSVYNSIAFGNTVVGFHQNNNAGGLTLHNNISYGNPTNFSFSNSLDAGEEHDIRNNISVDGDTNISNASASNNSWDLNVTADDLDFIDVNIARYASNAGTDRNPDGTLPITDLFKLKAGSDLIDVGVDVGLPFSGAAPDLGAFER